MGTASAEGDDRARRAVDDALHSPLLEDNDIRGAQHILLNITSGKKEVTMDEIFEITEFVQEEAGYGTDLIWGNCYDESLGDKLSVTVIATGFEHRAKNYDNKSADERIIVSLDDDPKEDKKAPAKKNGLKKIGFEEEDEYREASTFEFEDLRPKVDKYSRYNSYSYDEPYLKGEEEKEDEESRRKQMEKEQRRRERLRSHNVKLNNPKNIIELENEPAYLRRGVELDNIPKSSEEYMSKWTISDEEEPVLKESGNSFLHDNVD